MVTFSVIILNWNGLRHLKTFLPSVVQTTHPSVEIILADNHSNDASVEWVQTQFPEIKIITLEKNYGYCGGNNRAADQVNGEFLVFLNNDIKVEPHWLEPIEACFRKYSETAVLQPKMLSYTQPTRFEYAGAAGGFLDKLGYPWCRGRIFDTLETDNGQYDAFPNRIFWASGAAFCIRKEVFKKAGGFDEAFEFHMEEIDLCWRVQRMGFDIRFCPESVVYHLGGGSLETGSPRKVYYNFRNNLIMLTKNYSSGSLIPVLITRFFMDGLAAVSFIFSGKISSWKALTKSYLHFYKDFPRWLQVRGNLKDTLPLPTDARAQRPFSIVWEYYIKGNKTFSNVLSSSIVLLSFFSFTMLDRKK